MVLVMFAGRLPGLMILKRFYLMCTKLPGMTDYSAYAMLALLARRSSLKNMNREAKVKYLELVARQ